jgi:8-oxo-dGTP diphosphatase
MEWREQMAHKNLTTLCYLEQKGSYLMLHRIKKKNDMNQDKWLGVGGHLEAGESPEECLLREVKEETGLTLLSYQLRGIVTFVSDEYPDNYMFLYTSDKFEGTLLECNEGHLEWVPKEKTGQLPLWEGDLIFFELLKDDIPFFSLKLVYKGQCLSAAILNGESLELLDERQPDGSLTGRVMARFFMHREGILHGTAHVWIIRPNEKDGFDLLLQKRSGNKDSYPGCYDVSSAGHLTAGSDYLESAVRELEEELGIKALPEELNFVGFRSEFDKREFYGRTFFNQEVSQVYAYEQTVEEADLILDPFEVESVLWMDYKECLLRMESGTMSHCLNEKEILMLADWWNTKKYR